MLAAASCPSCRLPSPPSAAPSHLSSFTFTPASYLDLDATLASSNAGATPPPRDPTAFSSIRSCKRHLLSISSRRQPLLIFLRDLQPASSSSFQDPSLLDASIDEVKPGTCHKGALKMPSFVEIPNPLWANGAALVEDVLRNKHFLSTGCEGIDTLLGGGLREG